MHSKRSEWNRSIKQVRITTIDESLKRNTDSLFTAKRGPRTVDPCLLILIAKNINNENNNEDNKNNNNQHLWCCNHGTGVMNVHTTRFVSWMKNNDKWPPIMQTLYNISSLLSSIPPSSFINISQPESWKSLYIAKECRRLSRRTKTNNVRFREMKYMYVVNCIEDRPKMLHSRARFV